MPDSGNTSANVTVSNRGEAWLSHLAPVLNGSFVCPWRRLAMTTQKPYLRIDRLQVRVRGGHFKHNSFNRRRELDQKLPIGI